MAQNTNRNLRQLDRRLSERSSANLVLPRMINAQRAARRLRVARAKRSA
nr:hypothetical protein [Tessaracoccus bendigoensis]